MWTLSFAVYHISILGFPAGSVVKASACNAGDQGSIPGSGRSLEKEMATHPSILAWRISWTEEPNRLQSTGSQRVGHDWATSINYSHSIKPSNSKYIFSFCLLNTSIIMLLLRKMKRFIIFLANKYI